MLGIRYPSHQQKFDLRVKGENFGSSVFDFCPYALINYRRLNPRRKMRMIYLERKRRSQNQMRNKKKVKKRMNNLRR